MVSLIAARVSRYLNRLTCNQGAPTRTQCMRDIALAGIGAYEFQAIHRLSARITIYRDTLSEGVEVLLEFVRQRSGDCHVILRRWTSEGDPVGVQEIAA